MQLLILKRLEIFSNISCHYFSVLNLKTVAGRNQYNQIFISCLLLKEGQNL